MECPHKTLTAGGERSLPASKSLCNLRQRFSQLCSDLSPNSLVFELDLRFLLYLLLMGNEH